MKTFLIAIVVSISGVSWANVVSLAVTERPVRRFSERVYLSDAFERTMMLWGYRPDQNCWQVVVHHHPTGQYTLALEVSGGHGRVLEVAEGGGRRGEPVGPLAGDTRATQLRLMISRRRNHTNTESEVREYSIYRANSDINPAAAGLGQEFGFLRKVEAQMTPGTESVLRDNAWCGFAPAPAPPQPPRPAQAQPAVEGQAQPAQPQQAQPQPMRPQPRTVERWEIQALCVEPDHDRNCNIDIDENFRVTGVSRGNGS